MIAIIPKTIRIKIQTRIILTKIMKITINQTIQIPITITKMTIIIIMAIITKFQQIQTLLIVITPYSSICL